MCLPQKNGISFVHITLIFLEATMPKQIFINLPVRDLPKARAFYEAIGAVNNPQFSDATGACMVVSDTIFVMLLTHAKWASFTQKPIADAQRCCKTPLVLCIMYPSQALPALRRRGPKMWLPKWRASKRPQICR